MFKTIKDFRENLIKPMPLHEFEDYDEYWKRREKAKIEEHRFAPPTDRAKLISEYIEPDSTVLDIGCGDGTLIDYISRNNSPERIVGVDISKEAVEYAKSRGYEAYKMDMTSDIFRSFVQENGFDYIILTEVLEHIREPEKVMLNIRDCFAKSIFVSIPNSGWLMHRLRLLCGRFPIVVIIYHVKEHVRFWTHRDFLYWSEHLGFRVVRYKASSGSKKLGIDLGRRWPSLFGIQIVYELDKKL